MREQRLTRSEIDHLEFALREVRRTGSYYGNYTYFTRRQAILERWVAAKKERSKSDALIPQQVSP